MTEFDKGYVQALNEIAERLNTTKGEKFDEFVRGKLAKEFQIAKIIEEKLKKIHDKNRINPYQE